MEKKVPTLAFSKRIRQEIGFSQVACWIQKTTYISKHLESICAWSTKDFERRLILKWQILKILNFKVN